MTTTAVKESAYFMPYQRSWLRDESRTKIWQKSRRIGATYVAAYEDVRDAIRGRVPACWFSSADETAAREYIEYCLKWAKVAQVAAESLGEQVVDEKQGVTTYQIRFNNGVKIHALSSNPKAFRSKGGKVTLDEFAWHEDARGMWAAARPCITWGFPLRILSTHHGVNSQFNKFVTDCLKGRLKWALHTTDIFKAVEDGLADKISGRTLTSDEREEWVRDEQASVGDPAVWAEEYCCKPQDEASAFLTYEQIRAMQSDSILMPPAECTGELYAGWDVARHSHLSVIWVVERLGSVLVTRMVHAMRDVSFAEQEQALYAILGLRNLRRCCIDLTGMGEQPTERAVKKFGRKVEGVRFSGLVKEDLANCLLRHAQDRTLLIPDDFDVREDLHSVRKVVTSSGNVRFDVTGSEAKGSHADRFWAAALACHAASTPGFQTPVIMSRKPGTGRGDMRSTNRIDTILGAPIDAFGASEYL